MTSWRSNSDGSKVFWGQLYAEQLYPKSEPLVVVVSPEVFERIRSGQDPSWVPLSEEVKGE